LESKTTRPPPSRNGVEKGERVGKLIGVGVAVGSDVALGIIVTVVGENVGKLIGMGIVVGSDVAPEIIVTADEDIGMVGIQAEITKKTARAKNVRGRFWISILLPSL